MTRPSEVTRDRILKAAERLFAERGYEGTSIRAIVARARVNQAAINYHFEGKEGLYREVLRAAFRGLTEHQLASAAQSVQLSPGGGACGLHPAAIAPAAGARRSEPACPHIQLGKRAADAGVSQAIERGGGAVHGSGDRSRASFPARCGSSDVGRSCDLAPRPMQRFCPQPGATCWAASGIVRGRSLDRVVDADHQPLGNRRAAIGRLSRHTRNSGDCRKKSFFPAIGCPKRVFEIQPVV